jgi:hypothetical protein
MELIMADPQSIFGNMMPSMSAEEADMRRRQELFEQEQAVVNDYPYDTNPRVARRQVQRQQNQARARMQQQMEVQTQQQKMARFEEEVRRRINTNPAFRTMDPLDRQEATYKVGVQVADDLGMQGLAGQLGGSYTKMVKDRIKKDLELEGLEAANESARKNAKVAGNRVVDWYDHATGDTLEQEFDADRNPIGSPVVTQRGKWETKKVNDIEYLISPTGQWIDPVDRDAEEVSEALERQKVADQAFDDADKEMAKVDKALTRLSRTSTGFVGKVLAELGTLPGGVGEDAAAVAGLLESIKAQLGFEELRKLKDSGASLGQVAIFELIALQSVAASLDQGLSPKDLAANLRTVKKKYRDFQDAVRYRRDLQDLNWGAPEYAEFVDKTKDWWYIKDPTTGRRIKKIKPRR